MHLFLKNSSFRQITLNNWISTLGDTLFYIAFIDYVSNFKFAPLAIFFITSSEMIPTVISIFIGTFADFQTKRIKKSIMISFFKVILYSIVTLILLEKNFTIISVLIICLINLISDSLGQYSGQMAYPIYVKIIKDDMTEALGFVQASGNIIRILGNFIGGILITIISIESISGINVLTFLFAFVGLLLLRRDMERFESEIKIKASLNFFSYWKHLVGSIKVLLNMKLVIKLMGTSIINNVIINSAFSIIPLILYSFPIEGIKTGHVLSFYTILFMLSMASGNFLTGRYFKEVSLKSFVLLTQSLAFLALIGNIFQNIPFIIAASCLSAFVNGIMTPRFRELIITSIPEESMGAINSSIGVIDIALPSLLTITVVFLASSINIMTATLFMVLLLIMAIIVTLKTAKF